jgi:two-component system sensor histidine kinase CpxA
MKLFLKIFLWYLVALAMMFGVIIFVTRTFQTEPAFSRWQRSARNQMAFYSATASQIQASGGDTALNTFLTRLSENGSIRDVLLVQSDGTVTYGDRNFVPDFENVSAGVHETGETTIEVNGTDPALGATPLKFADGRTATLAIRWEPPRTPSFFFDSWAGYMRLVGLLLTSVIVCLLLAWYLTSPLRKLGEATRKLAAGDLASRVARRVGRRRDEFADLAKDFDNMAARIESLIDSQQILTRDISHELRSPLARMNVALELAKKRSTPESAPLLERIGNEAERLNEMISRILTLSKLESGSEDYSKTKLDLSDLVRDIAADAEFEASGKGKSVAADAIENCSVNGNENLLRSAIDNVVRNAVRYTAESSQVNVSLKTSNGHAILKVRDHGGGVPQDEIENLFRPFYRVGEARERKTGGTGLGLAIAQRAVAVHGGTISAENVGDGLEVSIVLNTAGNGAKPNGEHQ